MGSNEKELKQLLTESGFEFKRKTHSGEMWEDAELRRCNIGSLIVIGVHSNSRAFHNIRAEIHRAVKKREEILAGVPSFEKKPIAKLGDYMANKSIIVRHDTGERKVILPMPPKEIMAKKTKKIRKFDKTTFEVMKLRVTEILQGGEKSPTKIRETLDREGFKMANGDPLTVNWCNWISAKLKREGVDMKTTVIGPPATKPPGLEPSRSVSMEIAPAVETAPIVRSAPMETAPVSSVEPRETTWELPSFAMDILQRQDMSDAKKVRLLLAYAEP